MFLLFNITGWLINELGLAPVVEAISMALLMLKG